MRVLLMYARSVAGSGLLSLLGPRRWSRGIMAQRTSQPFRFGRPQRCLGGVYGPYFDRVRTWRSGLSIVEGTIILASAEMQHGLGRRLFAFVATLEHPIVYSSVQA